MKPRLDIVIVNWNSGNQLSACVASISAASKEHCDVSRVIVVDNASTDGSIDGAEHINGMTIPLYVIRNNENRGFAAACNQGAHISSADYLLFLNPDTQLSEHALDLPIAFLDQADSNRYALVGVQLVNLAGEIHRSCSRFPTPWTLIVFSLGLDRLAPHYFRIHLMKEWPHNIDLDIEHCIGAFYLVRRKIFCVLGGFDERFFMYLEDLDFSKRLCEAGWRARFLAGAWAYHKGGGVSETIKAQRLFYSLRSRMLYSCKHFDRHTAAILNLITLSIEPFIRLAYAGLQGSSTQAGDILRAYEMLWRNLPQILHTNRKPEYGIPLK